MATIITVIMTTCLVFFHKWWNFNIIKKSSRYSCSIFKSVFLVSQLLARLDLQLLTATLNMNTSCHKKTYSMAYSHENKDENISKKKTRCFLMHTNVACRRTGTVRNLKEESDFKFVSRALWKWRQWIPWVSGMLPALGFLVHILTAAGPVW